MPPQIISCQAAVTNIWVSSCRLCCKTSWFVKGMLCIHRFGRQVRKRRIVLCQRKRRRCREEDRKMERRRGRKQHVIHSNTSSTLFAQLSLANSTSSGLLQKDGFAIRVFSLSDCWLFSSQLGLKKRNKEKRKGKRVTAEWEEISYGRRFSDHFLLHWQAAALLNNNQRGCIVWNDATIMKINGINETVGWPTGNSFKYFMLEKGDLCCQCLSAFIKNQKTLSRVGYSHVKKKHTFFQRLIFYDMKTDLFV